MHERGVPLAKQIAAVSFTLAMLCCLARPGRSESVDRDLAAQGIRARVAGTGERYNQLGDHSGPLYDLLADGRMLVLFVLRSLRRTNEPSDAERIKLHKSMLAYGGTYSVPPGKVVHHIDIEWDGKRLGTDQCGSIPSRATRFRSDQRPNKPWMGARG